MVFVRTFLRLGVFLIALVFFFISCLPFLPWLKRDARKVRPLLVRVAVFYTSVLAHILGMKVTLAGETGALLTEQPKLIVANHLSYLDVLAFSLHFRSSFVTSLEVKHTVFLGEIVTAAGCLFVDRKDRRNLGTEVAELTEAMLDGLNVAIFPEATSTNGDEVIRFRRPLFNAALQAKVPVVPLTINYLSVDGEPVSARNRDLVCWYGDMDFFPHFIKLFGGKGIEVQLTVGEPLAPEGDMQSLSEAAHARVVENFRPLSAMPT
jgi:lyso-ornithine lipid O-acyltransferase